ncbi:P pilus assembly protein, chaperone PapD [Roseofilum sp. BLCC_M91]|uniref:P pilus assembly protein, chaperone PapD n=1 Tax=Roseofilum halophilum BLCC-M91 TaxID=3022259 RepID=A0ABT7BE35_9CYAN|nr:hypothetical protein [Roseofilum halophilum]MDJ1177449.1 P pilus assembly protein, chaperone PapD [Roseofilum halophilum BLCC-M91]
MKLNFLSRITSSLTSIVLANCLLLGAAARANISISPMVVETQVNRGQATGSITVSNLTSEEFRARIYSAPFTYDPEAGFQVLDSSSQDLSPYLQFSPRELQIPATEQRRIRFIARFPPSLPDGEYRAVLFTENLKATIQEENDTTGDIIFRTTIVPRIGVAVYVRKGNISHELTLDSARYNPESKKLDLLAINTGKASVILQPEWTLKKDGREVKQDSGDPITVIAEGSRYINIDYAADGELTLEPGDYELSGQLGWGVNFSNKINFSVNFTVPSTPESSTFPSSE